MKILCIVPLSNLHPRLVFSLHILTCVPPRGQLHLSCESENIHCYVLKDALLPSFLVWSSCNLGFILLIWLSYSACVSISSCVPQGQQSPLILFSYWICIYLLQVAEGYKYKAYQVRTSLFSHWSWQVCNVVYFKYLKGLSLNKLWKVMHFTVYFKVKSLHL